MRGW